MNQKEFEAVEEWSHYKAQSITLNEFMNDWLPGIIEDHHKPSIFWNRKDSAVIAVNVLLNELEQEIEKY
ncbi:DUF2750 domain-containing protein [Paenibacillus sp. LjRoot56]|uniref:DUF2750 domain-containing protein n=1 Tax=Paenibacillus sp. LjRoot56 TaxID=3342333 RepID=UPI003ECED2A7